MEIWVDPISINRGIFPPYKSATGQPVVFITANIDMLDGDYYYMGVFSISILLVYFKQLSIKIVS